MADEYTTVTSKGQVVIPARFRKSLKIKPGTRISVHESAGRLVLQPVTHEFIDGLCGILGDTSDLIDRLKRDHEDEDID
jgi:AbrB family looped-hinge helix DNA binding protein